MGPVIKELNAVFNLEINEIILFQVVILITVHLVIYHGYHLQTATLILFGYELLGMHFQSFFELILLLLLLSESISF